MLFTNLRLLTIYICMNIFTDPFKVNHQRGNFQFDSKNHLISWYTPWKFNILNLKSWRFGSDDILSKKWMMFKFKMLVFGGYASQIQIFWTSESIFSNSSEFETSPKGREGITCSE